MAAAPPPPPSAFRVAANATSPWTTGNYTYDGSGNISTIGPSTDLVTNAYRYDRVGRLSSATRYDGTQQHSESYVHDSTGNLTQLTKGDVTLSYPVDQATNRLVATLATYDAIGNLTEAAGGARYTYDQLGMIGSDDFTRGRPRTGGPHQWRFCLVTHSGVGKCIPPTLLSHETSVLDPVPSLAGGGACRSLPRIQGCM